MADDFVRLSDRMAEEFASGEANLERATAIPGVPPPSEDLAAVVRSVRALKTVVDVLTGTSGSVLDKAVTSRDLMRDNVMVYTPSTGLSAGATTIVNTGGGTGGGGGGGDPYEDPRTVYPVPPTPTNLSVMGSYTSILLDWDLIDYRNHAFTEVLRYTSDNLAMATVIGTAVANQYADMTGVLGGTYYYWVRAVNLEAVTGNVNASAGTAGGRLKIGTTDLGPLVVEAGNLAAGAVTAAKFAASIEPVGIVSAVPGVLSTQTVFNTTDGKLYRWNGSAYIATLPAADIAGTLADAQIASLAATKITGQLSDAQLAAIAATKITGQLTDSQLAAIAAAKLTGQITTTQITDNAITTAKINAGAVTAAQIAADTITASQIAAGAITSSELAAGAVVAGKIAAGTIVAGDIASGTITATQIAAGTITGANIAAGTIAAGNIAANTITANEIAANAVTSSELAANSVVPGKIAAGAISATEISAGAINATHLAANSIAVGTAAVQNGAIVNAMIASAAIDNAKIADGTIQNAKIADGTIQNAKIADATIQSAKIASLAASKIASGSISVGNVIQSSNYVLNTAGWMINGDGGAEFGPTSIRGQLTASQIDTRGLTIKNAAGETVFDSGGSRVIDGYRNTNPAPQDFAAGESFYFKLGPAGGGTFDGPASAGYGSLRTLRPYGSSTDFSGGAAIQWFESNGLVWSRKSTSATTWGAWEAVPNGTITSSNVSTYIASAAIGNAQIGTAAIKTAQIDDLAVNSLKIDGQAVTTAKLGTNAAVQVVVADYAGRGWATYGSGVASHDHNAVVGTINTSADGQGRVLVMLSPKGYHGSLGVNGFYYVARCGITPNGGGSHYVAIVVTRNGVELRRREYSWSGSDQQWIIFPQSFFYDTPGAGVSATYNIYFYGSTTQGAPIAASYQQELMNMDIILMEVRK